MAAIGMNISKSQNIKATKLKIGQYVDRSMKKKQAENFKNPLPYDVYDSRGRARTIFFVGKYYRINRPIREKPLSRMTQNLATGTG